MADIKDIIGQKNELEILNQYSQQLVQDTLDMNALFG